MSVFDDLNRLDELRRNDRNSIKTRIAEILYNDKYDILVHTMRNDWKHLKIKHERKMNKW